MAPKHPAADLVVLVRDLQPTGELDAVVELLTWVHGARPDLDVRVVARSAGPERAEVAAVATVELVDATPEARVGRLAQRAGLAAPAAAARSRALDRLLAGTTAPVLVTASAGRFLNWVPPTAAPVVGRVAAAGTLDELDPADRAALDERVTAWADGPDLLRQRAERDDAPEVRSRQRAQLARDLAVPADAPLVLLAGGEGSLLPSDHVLGVAWALLGCCPGVHLLWATPASTPAATAQVERHLADAGLGDRVHPCSPGDRWWQVVAAADAVWLVDDEPAAAAVAQQIAPERVVRAAGPDAADDAASTAAAIATAIAALLPGGDRWSAPDDRWHAPVGGPRILELLGLDR